MKKIAILLLSFCLLISFSQIPYSAFANSTTTPVEQTDTSRSCYGIDANSSLLGNELEIENMKAAFMYELNSDSLLYSYNADEKMHPASLVKLLTAIVAIENGNPEDIVVVSNSAVESIPYDAVSDNALQPGEEISLMDLLYLMMVGSANDAAAVIAEHIGGSQGQFVQMMNQYASDIGCVGTQIVNPHGLHNNDQYTTARDVARILDAAFDNETFRTVFSAIEYTVSATDKTEERYVSSRNSMMDTSSKLYYDSRVIGGRTGVAGDGSRCLATVAENNGMQVVCVVMGSETVYQEDGYSAITVGSYKETSALLDAAFSGYQAAQILFAGQTFRQCAVIDGDSDVVLGPQVSVSTVLPQGVSLSDLTFHYEDLPMQAPIAVGTMLSTVEIWHAGMCLATAELYALNSVPVKTQLLQQESDSATRSGGVNILITIIVIISVLVLVFLVVKFSNKIKILITLQKNRKRRRNHRRSK